MKRTGWVAAGLFLLVLLAQGAYARDLEVFETTLDNGLKVLLLEERKAPVLTFHVWYRVGSRNEQPGHTGLAHFMEHMMFKGTPQMGAQAFSQVIRKNGGRDNAFTSQDYTGYFVTLAADRGHLPLELEPDRMVNLLLNPDEVERERSVVMEERRLRTDDDPTSSLWEKVQASAFTVHPYGNPVIGWMEDIRKLSRGDLQAFYKTYYAPNNAVVVVVGDFNRAELLPRIQKAFGAIPRGPAPPPVRIVEPPQNGERRVTLTREDAKLPFVMAVYHAPNLTDADSYPLEVLEVILAGGKSARLHRNVVYEKQLALNAGAYYSRVSADPQAFALYASSLPGKKVEELEQALYAEVERLKTELVSPRELEKAKNQIQASFVFSQDSIFSLAQQLASYEIVAGWPHWKAYLPGIRAVTSEDVQRVAKKYLTTENRTVGVLIPGGPATGGEQPATGTPPKTEGAGS
ncbi:MAG TPA: pitrilysin family protein [Candidatus Methylomirabilis sp.]|nr:pitrilysin family protein [Candidatus Methylomirabilis sp.]